MMRVWINGFALLDKILPSTALLPIEAEYGKVDGYCPETCQPLFKNRNIPKGYTVNPVFYQPCKRDTALTAVSIKFGDHQKDYDYLVPLTLFSISPAKEIQP